MNILPTGRVVGTKDGLDIVIERTFRAPIQDVWDSIVEPERMNRWIGTWSGEAGIGKRVSFLMTAEDATAPEDVLIHECEAPHRLLIDTTQGGGMWRLGLTLSEEDGITTLVFRQSIAIGDDSGSYGPGWEYYLDRLVAVHAGESFGDWDDYFPAQQQYWQDAALSPERHEAA